MILLTLFFWYETRKYTWFPFIMFFLHIFVLGSDCVCMDLWFYRTRSPMDDIWNAAKLPNSSWQGKAELLGRCRVPLSARDSPLIPYVRRWVLNWACTVRSRCITARVMVLLSEMLFVSLFMMTFSLNLHHGHKPVADVSHSVPVPAVFFITSI